MNYSGKFGPGPSDSFPGAGFNIDAPAHQGAGDSVTIPDARLLFSGDYSRSGADLIVSDQLHRVVVPGYFHGDKRPTLVSPDGAPLDPHVIEALTGHVQYAQAAGSAAAAAAKVVGHVVKMTGSASVVRNGVTVALNNGDNVLQNDVVQTGSGSSLGLVMIDGTTFNLSAGARLMLNDLTYDANSTSNASLFTLVQGAASFVAGQVAKTGDMKVGTPVATMGIRGTAVILDISAVDGKVSISVIDQRDGQVHAVQVYNTRGILIGTVTSNGAGLTLTPVANFEVIAQESNKTVAQVAAEFNAFQVLLQTYDAGKVLFPDLPQHTDANPNPNTPTRFAGSPTPDSPSTVYHSPTIVPAGSLPSEGTATPVVFVSNSPGPTPIGTPVFGADPIVVTVVIPATPLPFVVTPPTVSRISGEGGDHFGPVMSADGHFIVYDPDGAIFLYDRHTNTTITIAPAAGGFSYSGQTISADGRYVVFQGTDGTQSWVFIYNNDPSDAHYQQTTQLAAGGAPAVSGDGSRIAVEHGGNSIGIYDQQGHVIATITAAAIDETGAVWLPAISADGHLLAFWQTDASTPGGSGKLFVYDMSTGTAIEIASTATDAGMSAASFSADGRYVVYQSDAPGGHSEIYLYDLSIGQVVFHTANASGASYNPVISPDGNFIIFASDAQLAGGDNNSVTDTYVVDVSNPASPVYNRVSNLANGSQPDAAANLGATISAGGLYVSFASSAAPGTGDIFLVDPTSGRSAIIQERANSPAILTAGGVIALTGDHNGATLGVVDPNGRFTASFNAQGDIVWSFSEPKSDFATLLPGQKVTQDFVILLTNASGTTTIPVRVVVYDADLPATLAVANPGTIAGDNSDNALTGTAGNDILQGFGGDDTLVGLTGVDRAVYTDATGGITVDLAAGTVTGPGVDADTLIGIEAIQGSNFVDHYSAVGFAGDSGLPGVPVGFNSFEGMAGNDIVTGNVNVQGQALTRISYASASAAVTVDFAAGTATGNASVGTDHFTNVSSVIGSGFGDTLRGSNNAAGSFEQFDGRGGNDTIEGRGGYDFAAYNSDAATHSGIMVNLAAGTVVGDASIGSDTLRSVEGVRGTHFADTYNAAGFNGGSTNAGSLGSFNNFDGQDGNDSITGNGNTRIQYSQSTAAVLVDLANTSAGGTGLAQDRADAINHTSLDLASVGIDVIYGGVDAVMGSMFGDSLLGSANNEHFMGLAGDDFINGRGGFDVAQYNNMTHTTGGISVDLADGIVTGDGSNGTDTLRSIEGVQGTNFADSFDATGFGDPYHLNALLDNVGNYGTFNQFEGMAGDDEITGNGDTRAVYFNAAAAVTVDLASGTGRGTADEDLAKVGFDTFAGGVNGAFGGAYNDTLRGSDNTVPGSIEQFDGRGGDDTVDGRGGFDQVTYGNDRSVTAGITVHMAVDLGDDGPLVGTVDGDAQIGHDTLISIESVIGTRFADIYDAADFVGFNEFQGLGGNDQITGNGSTRVVYYNATSGVTVDMKLGTADGDASVGHDTFSGVNQARGSDFGDSLHGDDYNNTLGGLGGDDLLDGRGGDDDLHGGAGADTFVYTTGADTVHDFNRSEGDRIDLSGIPGVHSLADVIFDTEGGNTLIDFGERGTLDLRGVTTLVESDFIFAVPVNDAPDFTGDSAGESYAGNPVAIATNVAVSDIDSANYAGGSLTATVTDGGHEGDTLSIAENDYIHYDASGQIVSFDSDGAGGSADFVNIGTLTNNINSLTIALNGDATDEAVAHLAEAIRFENSKPGSVTPGTRTVTFTLDDGGGTANGGHNTDYFNATVDVTAPAGNNAPVVTGDMAVVAVTGGSEVALTLADLGALDPDTEPGKLTFTIDHLNHGILTFGDQRLQLGVNDTFTLADVQAGDVYYQSVGTYVGQDHITLSLSDNVQGTPTATAVLGVTVVNAQFTVLTAGGYDFDQDNPVGAMGSGAIDPLSESGTAFTIVAIDGRHFVVTGTGFEFQSREDTDSDAVTLGTITSITELGPLAGGVRPELARFDLHVSAAVWFDAVVAAAAGDNSQMEALTSQWTFNFIGNAGADAFFAADVNDIFTGRAGNDTLGGEFGYDRANYGGATGPIDVQLADGIVTGNGSVGTDTLQSIELITGSNFADTFDATGFNSTSANAGSTVTNNVAGLFNEFEGRGGADTITGNGQTRVSYYHATAGVVVTFNLATSWATAASGASGSATGDASVGTDTFTGVNHVRGTFFNDTFTGSSNPNQTTENFEGLGGDDSIDGGLGFDRAQYFQAADDTGITVNLAAGLVTGGIDTGTDTLRSIEAIWGTNFADTYDATGFDGSSLNAGKAGNGGAASSFNEFEGGGGDDLVTGNGNTRVAFSHATGGVVVTLDPLTGGAGTTGAGTAAGNDTVGNDTFISGVTRVRGSEFNDIIGGNGAANVLEGQGGNDVIDGRGGSDALAGGTGADIFVYGAGSGADSVTDFNHFQGDRIDLRAFGNIHSLADLQIAAATVSGNPNSVSITSAGNFGGGNHLDLQGVALGTLQASDFIFAGQVAVTVQTPAGYDFSTVYDGLAAGYAGLASGTFASVNSSTHMFIVDAVRGITFELIGVGFTYDGGHLPNGGTITEINILDTTNPADPAQLTQDHVLVNSNGWSIEAAGLVDYLGQYNTPEMYASGLAGLNGIFGAATYNYVGSGGFADNHSQPHIGADVFLGGDNADVFNGMPGPFGEMDPGSDTVDYSRAGGSVVANLFTGTGSSGAAAGDIYLSIENLRGSDFDDTLTGDGNNNVIEGGLGNDTLDGGANGYGIDTVSYEHATDGVSVSLVVVNGQQTGAAGFDTLTNFEGLRGSNFDDILTGNGNSVLEGGAGDDHLIGHAGQSGVTASYEHADRGVTVDLSITSPQNTGGAGTDTLTNIANLQGSQFNDILTGDSGNNILFGNSGNDTFVFNETGIGHDTIGDFMSGQDHIQLNYAAFDPNDANSFNNWYTSHVTLVPESGDLLINLTLTGQDTILIRNVSIAGLHANDFILPSVSL